MLIDVSVCNCRFPAICNFSSSLTLAVTIQFISTTKQKQKTEEMSHNQFYFQNLKLSSFESFVYPETSTIWWHVAVYIPCISVFKLNFSPIQFQIFLDVLHPTPAVLLLPSQKFLQEKDGVVSYLQKILRSEDISKFRICVSRFLQYCRVPPQNFKYEIKGV